VKENRHSFLRFACTVLTIIMALAWLFPLYWILTTSLTAESDTIALPPSFVPIPPNFEAFAYVIENSPIFRWYFNTILVASVITVVSILVSLMCAYALSIMEFKGKGLINIWLLLGFMIPFGAMVIPLFMLMNQMHLVNSHLGVILPQIATPLSVIVFKRFFDQVPKDFRDAATIDGANDFHVLFNIYIPLNWSIIWAMAIITFIGAWNNFLWPFIVTNSTPMLTIPVGMTQVQSAYGVAFAKTSAVAVMASIPTALAYIIFQKRVTQGVVAAAGIK
jgi:multiple sugar transport system permease protein